MANTKQTPVFQAQNLTMYLEGTILVARIDLAESAGETSGGNIRVASTGGNQTIMGPKGLIKIGINAFQKVDKVNVPTV